MATDTTHAGADDRPVRVLVASRDRVYAAGLCRTLEAHGCLCTRCAPGSGGEPSAAETAAIDVVVVETDGLRTAELELVAGVRAVSPLIEVIAVASAANVHEAVAAFRSGLFAVMEQAEIPDRLVDAVRGACRRKRRAERRMAQLDSERRWDSTRRRSLGRTDRSPAGRPGGGGRR